jgi:hypothetical protein
VLDRLIAECGADEYSDAITVAQADYFGFAEGRPAAAHMALQSDWQEKGQWLPALRAWSHSQRSLAQIQELRQGRVRLVDLIGGASFDVVEDRNLYGVERGDVVEVRLVGFAGAVYFGRTFVYHPKGTASAIRRRVGDLLAKNKSRADILDALATLRIRCERYRHVSALRIYESDESIPQPTEAVS